MGTVLAQIWKGKIGGNRAKWGEMKGKWVIIGSSGGKGGIRGERIVL